VIPLVVATWYAGVYVGQPLYCGGVYAETTEPWVALSIEADWQCWDLVQLSGVDVTGHAWSLMARVGDTGPFGDNCVMYGDKCLPIVADVPKHLAPFVGLSSPVRLYNVTAQCRKMGYCDLIRGHQ
jgi:hypothetical protein